MNIGDEAHANELAKCTIVKQMGQLRFIAHDIIAQASVRNFRRVSYNANGRTPMVTAAKVYQMLGNESLWEVAGHCHKVLSDAKIPYAVCGGVAVCLHGYQRNTTDLDLVIGSSDSQSVHQVLADEGFVWNESAAEFRTGDGIAVQFLIAGQRAGKGSEVLVSEPVGEKNVETLEGLSVVRLSRLIEMKIACGSSNIRRTHKDFADVVELIATRNLDGSFARLLHKSLRPKFRQLVRNAAAGDD